jgi:hypothetical protein
MGEGYRIAILMISGFVLMALAAISMVATGKTDVATLKELFISLGVLAGLFGLPQVVQAWIQTRGQTSGKID